MTRSLWFRAAMSALFCAAALYAAVPAAAL